MSKNLERIVCSKCAKTYLFGGAYEETVCPGCLPAREKFERTKEQSQRLLQAWRASLRLKPQEQEATAA